MLKKLLILCSLAMFVTVLAGCNTLQGAGEDIQAAGEGIQDVADGN